MFLVRAFVIYLETNAKNVVVQYFLSLRAPNTVSGTAGAPSGTAGAPPAMSCAPSGMAGAPLGTAGAPSGTAGAPSGTAGQSRQVSP